MEDQKSPDESLVTPEEGDSPTSSSTDESPPTSSQVSHEGSPTNPNENLDGYLQVEAEGSDYIIVRFTPEQFSYIKDLIEKSNRRREYMRVKNRERYARLKAEGKRPSQKKPPQEKEKRGRKPIVPPITDPNKLLVRVISR